MTVRQPEELKSVFSEHYLFDRIVAKNARCSIGSATLKLKSLAEKAREYLGRKKVSFLARHVIVATREPHQHAALEAIKETGAAGLYGQ